jgi:uncharacterized membrane protein
VHNFDPSFTWLGTFASAEAIFIATFVLIAQNRLAAQEEKTCLKRSKEILFST